MRMEDDNMSVHHDPQAARIVEEQPSHVTVK